jgi:hypothetical protein
MSNLEKLKLSKYLGDFSLQDSSVNDNLDSEMDIDKIQKINDSVLSIKIKKILNLDNLDIDKQKNDSQEFEHKNVELPEHELVTQDKLSYFSYELFENLVKLFIITGLIPSNTVDNLDFYLQDDPKEYLNSSRVKKTCIIDRFNILKNKYIHYFPVVYFILKKQVILDSINVLSDENLYRANISISDLEYNYDNFNIKIENSEIETDKKHELIYKSYQFLYDIISKYKTELISDIIKQDLDHFVEPEFEISELNVSEILNKQIRKLENKINYILS